ncbi:Uncharacterised protein [Legionella beliardensis]|uniref:F-box domain-containing protein n=1 Tax=Legionella beliardensis TaxID=91822 RepID=A0A378I043_9GAMM|nr:hypothetical protein [Legionella beliardensis]STX28568.1 Uncharacterised protein [Legionella beliardensis]
MKGRSESPNPQESSQNRKIELKDLPEEIFKTILHFLPFETLATVRELSKTHKNVINSLLTSPKNVVAIVGELPSFNAMLFLNYYTQTEQYKNLLTKFEKGNTLTASEIVCISLTTDNIYKIDSERLQRAISQLEKELNPNLLENLKLMNSLIKLNEIHATGVDAKKYYREKVENQFKAIKNHDYINLQGADLSSFNFSKLAGANFNKATFNLKGAEFPPSSMISRDSFLSEDKMRRELNQLAVQIKHRPTEEKRLLRLGIFKDFKQQIRLFFDQSIASSDTDTAKYLISLVDMLIKHPISNKTVDDWLQDTLFTSPVGLLQNFKKELEKILVEQPQHHSSLGAGS